MHRLPHTLVLLIALSQVAWRSTLYPVDWNPGFSQNGRFLHDFSYAGYHAGELDIPDDPPGIIVDVTAPPYDADASGATDSTDAIQQAIDDVGAAGGGIVYLPAGTFAVSTGTRGYALHIGDSHVVMRGAGPAATRILNTETVMRLKVVVTARPKRSGWSSWYGNPSDVRSITADVTLPTTEIQVDDASGYNVGDWVVLRSDMTADWIAEHGMTGVWLESEGLGPLHYRQIMAISGTTITIDTPTRYPMLLRDGARMNRIADHLEEVGIEQLSIGNIENTTPGFGSLDYQTPGTGAYEVHAALMISLNHVVNGWVRDVSTFRPVQNSSNVHTLSSGLRLEHSRYITVQRAHFQRAKYKGQGGNGYLMIMTGADNLVVDSRFERGRHNVSFAFMQSTGNVIHNTELKFGELPGDFHQRLSPANLLDNVSLERDQLEGKFRDCCTHGQSTSQSVYWNTEGLAYPLDLWPWEWFAVISQQYGDGYVIGTRGPANKVSTPGGFGTEPVDWVEGEGLGDSLVPASLFLDQRARRLGLPIQTGDDGPPAPDGGPLGGDTTPGGDAASAGDARFGDTNRGDTAYGDTATAPTGDDFNAGDGAGASGGSGGAGGAAGSSGTGGEGGNVIDGHLEPDPSSDPSGGCASSVPQPSAALLLLGVLMGLRRRRR